MIGWTMLAQWASGAAVMVAVASTLWLVYQRDKTRGELVFAIVSASLAISLMRPWAHAAPNWMQWVMVLGSSVTCNGFWLVSRAVFRAESGIGRPHVYIAAGFAALFTLYRLVTLQTNEQGSLFASGLGALVSLGSSTLLALGFLEALRGWSTNLNERERRIRMAFMLVFGTCVMLVTLVTAAVDQGSLPIDSLRAMIGIGSAAMISFTLGLLWFRRQNPLGTPQSALFADALGAPEHAISERDVQLANALRYQLDDLQVYLEPELKVAALAERLGTAEHKLSRVITQVMGEKNFNQLLNRYRINHACRLLIHADGLETRSIVEISGACGFASLGPFNRAFKAATGHTPTTWRSMHAAPPKPDFCGTNTQLATDSNAPHFTAKTVRDTL